MRMPEVGSSTCSSSDTSESERSWAEEGDESTDWRQRDKRGKYACNVCDVVVTKPALLEQHMASHSEEVRVDVVLSHSDMLVGKYLFL